ncbi:putative hydrolase [Streptomyces sp. NBRC 110611]|uniref:NUDIX hydrolase n=1 Tax=Streptomyces sp. NBRC 110611 TaxID=1621259 RepID=UPI000856F4B4|nr:NUDIX hydrolase [Streptomyces sp. NBRC 110611]GAU64733.1 putative hydrolase [Streptomyces sp. NBRC 110611]
MTSSRQSVVRAAGCVLWRRTSPGNGPEEGDNLETGHDLDTGTSNLEIGLVHRPKYDDWSHPKGKLKRGEDALAGAVREVTEETGMHCRPGAPLPTSYYLAAGRPKQVHYWAAEAVAGSFIPSTEVDRLLWLPPAEARARLTYERDRPLVDALLATLRLT